jgi:phosphocarrier protein HPr
MISKDVTIINKLGLHARAAAKFVSLASRFSSSLQVSRNGREVNGKSIMGIMMLAASKDSVITLTAEGEDEEQIIDALVTLIENRFDEAE